MNIDAKKSKLVVKHNSLIEASFNLSLVENRIMLLAIVGARKLQELTQDTPVTIKVSEYLQQYPSSGRSSYLYLQEASKSLFERKFSYLHSNGGIAVERWVNRCIYHEDKGEIELYFGSTVIDMIGHIEKDFTKYFLESISDFKSKYSIRIFELASKWERIGESPLYTLEDFREKIGLEKDDYDRFCDLNRRVLDISQKEINATDKIDFKVSYHFKKSGRSIVGIQLKVEPKVKKMKDLKPMKLTESQIDLFGDKLSRDVAFQSDYIAHVGETTKDYAHRIKVALRDRENVTKWGEHLARLGFRAKYIPE
ncbi:replication initiation protein RepM [Acinetobacter sp. P1(2025)]|uniref:replication initiation protein RepM n=1 Tax=Acinetobacter sp. P1(2025) TaxID=3446120 RepID=UPI003F530B02